MLKRIISPSAVLLNFVLSLCLRLSKLQQAHLWRTVKALIVSDKRKTLARLYRQWVEAPDESAVADFFRVSPWSSEDMQQGVSQLVIADMIQHAEVAQVHQGKRI